MCQTTLWAKVAFICYSKFTSYITENTLKYYYKKQLLLCRVILFFCLFYVYFENLSKQIKKIVWKPRKFILMWAAYTVNSGLWKFVINICLYSIVYWVTAAKGGLWINGIEQELALQVTDRLHAFVCNRRLENQRIYWQPNSEFIESYKSNCKPMHIILKTRWRHHPKFLLSTKMKKLHGDRHVTTRRAVPFPCGW